MEALIRAENLDLALDALSLEELQDILVQNDRPFQGRIRSLKNTVRQLALVRRDMANRAAENENEELSVAARQNRSISFEIDVSDLRRNSFRHSANENVPSRSTAHHDAPPLAEVSIQETGHNTVMSTILDDNRGFSQSEVDAKMKNFRDFQRYYDDIAHQRASNHSSNNGEKHDSRTEGVAEPVPQEKQPRLQFQNNFVQNLEKRQQLGTTRDKIPSLRRVDEVRVDTSQRYSGDVSPQFNSNLQRNLENQTSSCFANLAQNNQNLQGIVNPENSNVNFFNQNHQDMARAATDLQHFRDFQTTGQLNTTSFSPDLIHNFELFNQFMMFVQLNSVPQQVQPALPTSHLGASSSQRSNFFEGQRFAPQFSNFLPNPSFETSRPSVCHNQNINASSGLSAGAEPFVPIDVKKMSYISTALKNKKIMFSGNVKEDPDRFLQLLEEFRVTMGLRKNELFSALPSALTGQALEWLRMEEEIRTFDQFTDSLRRVYRAHNYQDQLLRDAFNRKQGKSEDILSFVTHIRMIFSRMEPRLSLDRQLDITCDNLNPQLIQFVFRPTLRSFDDLVRVGKEVELKHEQIKTYKDNSDIVVPWSDKVKSNKKDLQKNKKQHQEKSLQQISAVDTPLSPAAATVTSKNRKSHREVTAQIQDEGKLVEKNSEKPRKTNSGPNQQNMDVPKHGECYRCRKPGHNWKDCPNEGHNYFCYGCGKPRVIKPKCPNCNSAEENSRRSQPEG